MTVARRRTGIEQGGTAMALSSTPTASSSSTNSTTTNHSGGGRRAKRRPNKASAERYRRKKKEELETLHASAAVLTREHDELARRADALEMEKRILQSLLALAASPAPAPAPSPSPSLDIAATSEAAEAEGSVARRLAGIERSLALVAGSVLGSECPTAAAASRDCYSGTASPRSSSTSRRTSRTSRGSSSSDGAGLVNDALSPVVLDMGFGGQPSPVPSLTLDDLDDMMETTLAEPSLCLDSKPLPMAPAPTAAAATPTAAATIAPNTGAGLDQPVVVPKGPMRHGHNAKTTLAALTSGPTFLPPPYHPAQFSAQELDDLATLFLQPGAPMVA